MARNTLKLDTTSIEKLLIDLDSLGGNVKQTAELALKKAGVQIMNDTILAVQKPNLPRQGEFSHNYTRESIIHWPKVEWDGNIAWIPVGFDFSKVGAGGFLIEGTPRMNPATKLRQIYKGKRYMGEIQKMMQDVVWESLKKEWGV